MTMITRRRLLFIAPLGMAVLAAGPGQAQQLSLSEISGYLNSFDTAEGQFTQINADDTISTGTIFIRRPGRIRFEYDPPEQAMVIAGGGQLAVFDPRSNTGPDRYPLRETPLKIILQDDIDLSRTNMVTAHTSDGTTTSVTAQDPENPDYGNIQLVFTGDPVQLRQWVITDDTGRQTTVVLGDLVTGAQVPNILFNIRAEMRDWPE
ncbi:MAG: outer membrane lipoprotein carrier protein LolA [Salibaculum sp.]|uniref:LolA family protein n=1 Tax=Roseovarius halophilus (ex Wu et al. 2025) TaxID=3376060 RepID=UPI00286FE447|nr:outer membrane lipoprotein carrier protein LolA [Salibaculum sp.]MDR9427848.1 outer membrane lipoprotein carrier protein LolA [Salibaculum sp.]MDR9483004.1 outer membrane lipoprotein carrier protein LolA [Salibaculum sp.]